MITVNSRILENSYTSSEWATDNPVLPNRVLGYDSTLRRYKMGNGIDTWSALPWWSDETSLAAYSITLDTTEPSSYTLTSPQLASVNAFGPRYPNFVALIAGRQVSDIQPTYTGSPGSFTQIDIQLHDDGSGLNADTTLVQFS